MKMSRHGMYLLRKYRNALKQVSVLGVDAIENEFLVKELKDTENDLDEYIAQMETLIRSGVILTGDDLVS